MRGGREGSARRVAKKGARRVAKDSEGDEGARLNEGIQAGAFLEGELPRKQIEARKGSRASHKEGVTASLRRFCLTSRQAKEGSLRACTCKYKGLISRTYDGPMEV